MGEEGPEQLRRAVVTLQAETEQHAHEARGRSKVSKGCPLGACQLWCSPLPRTHPPNPLDPAVQADCNNWQKHALAAGCPDGEVGAFWHGLWKTPPQHTHCRTPERAAWFIFFGFFVGYDGLCVGPEQTVGEQRVHTLGVPTLLP